MIEVLRPYTKYQLVKIGFTGVCFAWAVTSTVLLLRSKPILIGIDENGVRVIAEDKDKLVLNEKLNLIKRFVFHYYNFDANDYDGQLTVAGNLMNNSLWETKQQEFRRLSLNLKEHPTLLQQAKIEDIRLIDECTYEVDLTLSVQEKLHTTLVKLRTEVKIIPHVRSTDNPFSWEVNAYAESTRS